jgi:hypothetical protein
MLNIDCPELYQYLNSAELVADYNKRPNKVILVIGESGIGKTTLVKEILRKLGYSWFQDSGANNICDEITNYMININLEDKLLRRKRCMLLDDAEIFLYTNTESFLLHLKNPHHIPIILIINKLYEKKFGEFKKYSRSKLFYIHPPHPRDLLAYLRIHYPQYDIAYLSTIIRNYKCAIGPILINIHSPNIAENIDVIDMNKIDIMNAHENIDTRRISLAKYMDYMRLMADSSLLSADFAKFLQTRAIRGVAGNKIATSRYTRYYTDINCGQYFRQGIIWYYYYYNIWNNIWAYDILYNMRYKLLMRHNITIISKPAKYLMLKYYKDDQCIKNLRKYINNNIGDADNDISDT